MKQPRISPLRLKDWPHCLTAFDKGSLRVIISGQWPSCSKTSASPLANASACCAGGQGNASIRLVRVWQPCWRSHPRLSWCRQLLGTQPQEEPGPTGIEIEPEGLPGLVAEIKLLDRGWRGGIPDGQIRRRFDLEGEVRRDREILRLKHELPALEPRPGEGRGARRFRIAAGGIFCAPNNPSHGRVRQIPVHRAQIAF